MLPLMLMFLPGCCLSLTSCLGDLAVGEALSGQSGHAELAWGKALDPGEAFAAGPGADGAEFLSCPSRERLCPAPGRQVHPLSEGFSRATSRRIAHALPPGEAVTEFRDAFTTARSE
jgi:hypothetical protein